MNIFEGFSLSLALICASGAKALVCAMRTKFYKQNLYKMKSLKIGDLLARTPIYRGAAFFILQSAKKSPPLQKERRDAR